jgi:hypothetical protein
LAAKSPLLQRRLADREKNAASTPTINFNLPDSLFGFLRPSSDTSNAVSQPVTHGDVPLLPPTMPPGPDLTLIDFCMTFSLGDAILAKLHTNGYTGTRTIKYIVVAELKEMGFKNGEIAAMKDAVEQWSRTVRG